LKAKKGPKAARPYHHGDLKNALLKAALVHIAKHGARTLSLREVARATGVSHASTYRHFQSKESVLATIAEQGFRMLSSSMLRAAEHYSGEPLEMLQATGVAYVEFGVAYPNHLQIMFGDAIRRRNDYPALVEASNAAYKVLLSVVREGIRMHRMTSENEHVVASAAWAIVHGMAVLMAAGHLGPQPSRGSDLKSLPADVIGLLRSGLEMATVRKSSPRQSHTPAG
jgi:AcrR family transcriptional regulator